MAKEAVPSSINALGEDSADLERVCYAGPDLYLVENFSWIGSWACLAGNIPHSEARSYNFHLVLMKKETFKYFFPDKELQKSQKFVTYYQNDHIKLVEWLVTTREVVEKALKTSKTG